MGEVLDKYGLVETFSLKTQITNSVVVSRGIAVVQYAKKDDAAEALKKLPFELSLGEMLDVDFYQSKESRMKELEIEKNTLQ